MITRFDPFPDFAVMNRRYDQLFRGVLGAPGVVEGTGRRPAFYLPIDVTQTEGGFRIEAALPGFSPDEVEVTHKEGTLSIVAKHAETAESNDGRYIRREMVSGDWRRRIALPGEVQADSITATFENGVLKLDVPVAPKAEPVRIAIGEAPTTDAPSA
ncbi:MAG: Hsp20/alpha crystallin family protein [Candidatus Dormibacteraeota bacterium]|nr:Hsp20/alpha crystallin family protein [Candidatus Dormibacteraeota bacterium]